jgi:UDP:flavonoid glycosyltransferase YjiC (YdhE family)
MGSRPPSRPGGVSNAERATIAAAVSRVLDDTRYRRPAEQLGRSIRRDASFGALIAELES